MTTRTTRPGTATPRYDHVYLGASHAQNERRTWIVIALCGAMMLIEIVGGLFYGSIALIADGLHMSTHAGALLLAALAYRWSRRHAHDPRFSFGTGKFGDLAGFTSAIVLAMIALLIGYEAVTRFLAPVPIHFGEAIPIAVFGLSVNIASVWLLGGEHDHHHGHGHHHSGYGHDEIRHLVTSHGAVTLEIFEDGVPPRFRLMSIGKSALPPDDATIVTVRPDGSRQTFAMRALGGFLESDEEIAEPHAFSVEVHLDEDVHHVMFEEHADHDSQHHRDNNMRAAVVHVLADAAVSVLVIAGLLAARSYGWLWMDSLAGIVGALVIASWSYGLVRDTGAILLDMTPRRRACQTPTAAGGGGGRQGGRSSSLAARAGAFGRDRVDRLVRQSRCRALSRQVRPLAVDFPSHGRGYAGGLRLFSHLGGVTKLAHPRRIETMCMKPS